jgi:multidrug resistance efflux pump
MYFAFYHSGSMVAPMMLGIAMMACVMLFIGLNPLLKRDLYALIATLLRTPDLREQSIAALFGYSRPWQRGPTLSQSQMSAYILLCLAYTGFIITMIINGPATWINLAWGPTATIVFVCLIIILIYDIYRRIGQNRGSIGNIRIEMPGIWFWLIAFTLAALALAPYTYEPSGQFQVVAQRQVDIRALTPGDVVAVYVKEGDVVPAGTLLLKLNDHAQIAAVAEAEGSLSSLQHQLALQLAGKKPEEIDEAKQKVEMAQKKYDFSLAESNRVDTAFRRNAASAQQRDQAVGQTAVDKEALEVARKQLDVIQSPTRSDEIEALKAQITKAEAQLTYNQQQLAYTEVHAPIAGRVVAQVLLNPIGHYFNNGDLIATVTDDSKLYAQIFMPEVEMGDLKMGARVRVKAYAYPGTEFYGKVDDIAPAAQTSTQGVVGNPENAGQSQTGYNVIRVLCEVDDPQRRLRPDMTGMAKVSGRSVPAGEAFLRPLIRALMVEVWSWLP